MSNDLILIVMLPLFFLVGLWTMYYSYTTFRDYQLIRDTPTSKIQSLSVGLSEVKGKTEPIKKDQEPVTYDHPLTTDPVIYYDLEIEEHREDDDGSDWHTVEQDQVGSRFYVDDGTGKVEVQIESPRFVFKDEDRVREKFIFDSEDEVPQVLREYQDSGSFLPDFLDQEKYRVTVRSIKPDQNVFIFGGAETKSTNERSSTNEENLIIKNPGEDSGGAVDSDQPQIISTKNEENLQSELRWKVPASFLGGLSLSAGTLYLFLSMFIF